MIVIFSKKSMRFCFYFFSINRLVTFTNRRNTTLQWFDSALTLTVPQPCSAVTVSMSVNMFLSFTVNMKVHKHAVTVSVTVPVIVTVPCQSRVPDSDLVLVHDSVPVRDSLTVCYLDCAVPWQSPAVAPTMIEIQVRAVDHAGPWPWLCDCP